MTDNLNRLAYLARKGRLSGTLCRSGFHLAYLPYLPLYKRVYECTKRCSIGYFQPPLLEGGRWVVPTPAEVAR